MQDKKDFYITENGICNENDIETISRLLEKAHEEWEWAGKEEIKAWLLSGRALIYKDTAAVLCGEQSGKIYTAMRPILKRINSAAESFILVCGEYTGFNKAVNGIKEKLCKNTIPPLILPVKPCPPLEAFLKNGFQLSLIAPLYRLRPFYILTLSNAEETMYNIKEILPKSATYTVSRLLENGYKGIAEQENARLIMAR